MNGRATAEAPANIAFIKYWGAHDLERGVPLNTSISMTLDRCISTCTVETRPAESDDPASADEVFLAESESLQPAPEGFARRVLDHLDRLRCLVDDDVSFRVATKNSFPAAAGLASSASGFAALTLATTRALGLDPSTDELSVLARRSGSGLGGALRAGWVRGASGRASRGGCVRTFDGNRRGLGASRCGCGRGGRSRSPSPRSRVIAA